MAYYNLPSYQNRNEVLDFSPVENALAGYQKGMDQRFRTQQNQAIGNRLASGDMRGASAEAYRQGNLDTGMGIDKTRMAQEDAARQRERQQVEWFGAKAKAVMMEQNPAKRAAIWQNIIARHPDKASLTPEYLDPGKGPELVAAEAGQYIDGLERQLKMAQINKLNRDASGAGDYGKAGTIVQDPRSGEFYSIQYGSRGEPRVTPLQIGGSSLQPAKGVDQVGDTLRDKATGRVLENIAPNLSGAERAKVVGRETGERLMGVPKAQAAMASADAKADLVVEKIDQAIPMVGSLTAGVGGTVLRNIPGTQARNLSEIIKTVVANSGFEELQTMRANSPTGGALGQVAVQELEMLQKTVTSLEQAQTPEQLERALREAKAFVIGSRQRRKAAFDATYGGQQPQNNQPQQRPDPLGLFGGE